jgi:hypothetical protein
MITLEVSHQDRETEIAIVRAKSNRPAEEIALIVDIIRTMRERFGGKNGPTIRAALAIARILDHRKASVSSTDSIFMTTCKDVLFYNSSRQSTKPFTTQDLESLIRSIVTMGKVRNGSDARITPLSRTSDVAKKEPLVADVDTSVRVDSSLEALESRIQSASSARLADIALGAKNDVDGSILEKKTDDVDSADDLGDVDHARENASRRFPRPPAFESAGLPIASVVSKK